MLLEVPVKEGVEWLVDLDSEGSEMESEEDGEADTVGSEYGNYNIHLCSFDYDPSQPTTPSPPPTPISMFPLSLPCTPTPTSTPAGVTPTPTPTPGGTTPMETSGGVTPTPGGAMPTIGSSPPTPTLMFPLSLPCTPDTSGGSPWHWDVTLGGFYTRTPTRTMFPNDIPSAPTLNGKSTPILHSVSSLPPPPPPPASLIRPFLPPVSVAGPPLTCSWLGPPIPPPPFPPTPSVGYLEPWNSGYLGERLLRPPSLHNPPPSPLPPRPSPPTVPNPPPSYTSALPRVSTGISMMAPPTLCQPTLLHISAPRTTVLSTPTSLPTDPTSSCSPLTSLPHPPIDQPMPPAPPPPPPYVPFTHSAYDLPHRTPIHASSSHSSLPLPPFAVPPPSPTSLPAPPADWITTTPFNPSFAQQGTSIPNISSTISEKGDTFNIFNFSKTCKPFSGPLILEQGCTRQYFNEYKSNGDEDNYEDEDEESCPPISPPTHSTTDVDTNTARPSLIMGPDLMNLFPDIHKEDEFQTRQEVQEGRRVKRERGRRVQCPYLRRKLGLIKRISGFEKRCLSNLETFGFNPGVFQTSNPTQNVPPSPVCNPTKNIPPKSLSTQIPLPQNCYQLQHRVPPCGYAMDQPFLPLGGCFRPLFQPGDFIRPPVPFRPNGLTSPTLWGNSIKMMTDQTGNITNVKAVNIMEFVANQEKSCSDEEDFNESLYDWDQILLDLDNMVEDNNSDTEDRGSDK